MGNWRFSTKTPASKQDCKRTGDACKNFPWCLIDLPVQHRKWQGKHSVLKITVC
jgi:hypothetical protein